MRKIAEALCNSSTCLSCCWWQGICIVFHLKFAANATLLFRCTVPTTMCLLLLYMRTKHLWIMLCPKTNKTTKKSTSNNSQGSSPQAATFPFFVVLLHLFCWDTLTKSTQAKDQRSPAGPSSPGPFPTARGDRRSAAIWQWFGNFLGFPSKDSGTKIKDWSLKHGMCRYFERDLPNFHHFKVRSELNLSSSIWPHVGRPFFGQDQKSLNLVPKRNQKHLDGSNDIFTVGKPLTCVLVWYGWWSTKSSTSSDCVIFTSSIATASCSSTLSLTSWPNHHKSIRGL